MFFKDALVRPAKIKSDDDLDAVFVAFGNHFPQHIFLHVGIGIMVFQLGRVKSHDTSGVDDQGIGGVVHQVIDQGAGIKCRSLIGGEVGLDHPEVIGFPPGDTVRPMDVVGLGLRAIDGQEQTNEGEK